MGLKIVTPPATTPLTLAEIKEHLRVDHADDDVIIAAINQSATSYLDGYDGVLNRCLVSQTWELTYDSFPNSSIEIPLPPLIAIASVKYDDADGNEQTLAEGTDYEVDLASTFGWIVPELNLGWPDTFEGINAVRIRFVAGYSAGVPGSLLAVIKLICGHLYEHREHTIADTSITSLPLGVEALIAPYRMRFL